jgi:hypothetical protein
MNGQYLTLLPDLTNQRLEQAVNWADSHDRNGAGLFIGMNSRAYETQLDGFEPDDTP